MEPQSRLGGSLAVQFDHVMVGEARPGKEYAKEARLKNANKETRTETEDVAISIRSQNEGRIRRCCYLVCSREQIIERRKIPRRNPRNTELEK